MAAHRNLKLQRICDFPPGNHAQIQCDSGGCQINIDAIVLALQDNGSAIQNAFGFPSLKFLLLENFAFRLGNERLRNDRIAASGPIGSELHIDLGIAIEAAFGDKERQNVHIRVVLLPAYIGFMGSRFHDPPGMRLDRIQALLDANLFRLLGQYRVPGAGTGSCKQKRKGTSLDPPFHQIFSLYAENTARGLFGNRAPVCRQEQSGIASRSIADWICRETLMAVSLNADICRAACR